MSNKSVREVFDVRPDSIPEKLLTSSEPLLLRGLVADWPLVRAGTDSAYAAKDYLQGFCQGATVGVFYGRPDIAGRIFYNDELSGFNYERAMSKLDQVMGEILRQENAPEPPTLYVGSTTLDTCLPGFRAENDIDFGAISPLASIWMGNRSRIAAHYDVPDNLACCAVGHRRFTLFPPEQLENLYVGPIDFTPAGQAVSLVDFHEPDFEKHPKFRTALDSAQLAELQPGDAIFIPSMWWHHVESLDAFNVLINYWWRQSPAHMGTPLNVLNHALLSLRDLPPAQRRAWQQIFRHYVFEADEETAAHIPVDRRGILAPIDELTARQIRADLLNKLNR
jgi:hypothetical protein